MIQKQVYKTLKAELDAAGVTLVAVSKTHPAETIMQLYELGQRIFGENRVQELLHKKPLLPQDIQWHLIGHLQTNKVKHIVPAVAMIESVDSVKLLSALEKEAEKTNRPLDVLLQLKIAQEDTKYGFDPDTVADEIRAAGISTFGTLRIRGVMGMASFVDDITQVRNEFKSLKSHFTALRSTVFADHPDFDQISMGMSGDFRTAIEEGSTIVRIGSLIFGERESY